MNESSKENLTEEEVKSMLFPESSVSGLAGIPQTEIDENWKKYLSDRDRHPIIHIPNSGFCRDFSSEE